MNDSGLTLTYKRTQNAFAKHKKSREINVGSKKIQAFAKSCLSYRLSLLNCPTFAALPNNRKHTFHHTTTSSNELEATYLFKNMVLRGELTFHLSTFTSASSGTHAHSTPPFCDDVLFCRRGGLWEAQCGTRVVDNEATFSGLSVIFCAHFNLEHSAFLMKYSMKCIVWNSFHLTSSHLSNFK